MAIEEPDYEVERTTEDYEIRHYPPLIVATTTVAASAAKAGNQAFPILAKYIFGDNRSRSSIEMTAPVTQTGAEKIAMTAPVTQQRGDAQGAQVVSFVMPARYTLATLPVPNDPRVRLEQIPARLIAVRRYRGTWSQDRFASELARLRTALERDGIGTVGEPVFARYNSPFSLPPLRRNEVWLMIEAAPPGR
jgi:hypothetical protein